jgi:hypothetical protein
VKDIESYKESKSLNCTGSTAADSETTSSPSSREKISDQLFVALGYKIDSWSFGL